MDNNNKSNNTKDTSNTPAENASSRIAITVVVVVGLLIAAILISNRPAAEAGSATAILPTPTRPPTQTSAPTATKLPTQTSAPTATLRPTQTSAPASTNTAEVQPTATSNPILNINWLWTSVTEQSTNQIATVPDPNQYTLVFNADGTLSGVADCNTFSGTYSQNNGLAIRITSVTNAACPEGSLEQQYLQLLANVASGGPDGSGNLALETSGGAERMLFRNGGTLR
jgi:heat shock protein HslJ